MAIPFGRRIFVPSILIDYDPRMVVRIGILVFAITGLTAAQPHAEVSGIHPHLAVYNDQNECGIGAVVPWAGKLWVITYPPHEPNGSHDKLYSVDANLRQTIHPESVGGTHAARMVHEESNQLFIGPYVIDQSGKVRAIDIRRMPGRLTGIARHLSDPANKVYYATMEEGFYEVDVRTLAVTELFADTHTKDPKRLAELPGYHGKGLYSGQGVLVYANNGENGREARRRPDVPSGVLAEWDGESEKWTVVRRNQFTEVTGPGGLRGNANPGSDPIWSIGWDHRSLILMCRHEGAWHTYRLPKSSHSYDGAHGWNTEWPRIRDIGERDLLMTMHGAFWRFPRTFTPKSSAGISPRSGYLKVIGDFCRWNDRLVFGCDDTARAEFLNKRRAKGRLEGPGVSHSNLWFLEPAAIDRLGPALGRGAVWMQESVRGGVPSDPFLFSGYAQRGLHIAHRDDEPRTFTLEIDRDGSGTWTPLRDVLVSEKSSVWTGFAADQPGVWMRITADADTPGVTAAFSYARDLARPEKPDPMFDGLARVDSPAQVGGVIRARGGDLRTLALVSRSAHAGKLSERGFYELDGTLKLVERNDPKALKWTENATRIPTGVIRVERGSVLYVDDDGRRWRLPRWRDEFDEDGPLGPSRIDREVATERDLFQAHGTLYELPARNAGGFARIRPIATHSKRIHDYASYRGLLVMSGVRSDASGDDPHIVRSDDGKAALWVGAVDDLWKLGKPRGVGGPWTETRVKAREVSDPYLMTGYDEKALSLSADKRTTITVEVDITGTGCWQEVREFVVEPKRVRRFAFPTGFHAYWVRFRSSHAATVTAGLRYE